MKKQQYEIDRIMKKVKNYEYVSFDIFDTLIKRNVSKPTDIFKIVEIEYEKRYNQKINNFKEMRIIAEKKSRNLVHDREPNLDDIYKNINLDSTINIEKLKNIEINLELNVCQQNKDFYEIYKYCVNKNKHIIITSDMYLNREIIEKILSKARIFKYEKLFLSNEIKLNKHHGKIYPYILKNLNIQSSQIIHIGDSKRGDYMMPMLYGIKSILIPKKIKNIRYYNDKELSKNDKIFYNMIESYINNNFPNNGNIYYQIGYEILGILLNAYSKWLLERLKENNISKIFFLAREGNLLKQAFDIIKPEDIESKYLYVSRRSTRVSLLKNVNHLEDVFEIVKMRRMIDIQGFFINVGLKWEEYADILEKYHCNKKTNINEIENFNLLFEEIKNDIIENAKREEENLKGYLEQEGFEGKVAVADVGWTGTMQNALNIVTKENNMDVDIYGFYMGQSFDAEKFIKQGLKQQGYLFEYNTDGYKYIRPFLNLFESFFLAQHGTTIKYSRNKDEYMPVLDECEYKEIEKDKFREIQKGALDFLKNFNESQIESFPITSDITWLNFRKLGLDPTKWDIQTFGKITYLETTKNEFANAKSLFYYLFHLKQLYIDFCNCSWKIGFLKDLLKINIDYYKLYERLMNCFNEKR